ncbi:MAG: hypothetical protein OXH93_15395 [Caldilineaceae bacterium]|nr:hypothetical protein [Caldilineaceae bacterium]
MFLERMAVEETLRRERLVSEARTYAGLRPYRRVPRWQARFLLGLGGWLVARGTALQERYRRTEARLALTDYCGHNGMEQTL